MKKVFLCIFTCLLAFFLMSHNVFAYELGRDVFEISSGQFTLTGSTNCLNNINNNMVIRNGCTDVADGLSSLGVVLPGGIAEQYLTGDFMQFWFYIGINNTNDSSDSFIRNINISNAYLDTVDVSMEQVNNSIGIVKITARATQTIGVSSFNINASGGSVFLVLYPSEFISAGKIVHWRIVPGVDYSNDIQGIVNAINSQPNYSSVLNDIKNKVPSAEDNASAIADEEEERTQDVVDQSEQDSQDSQDEVDQATASLLAVGGQVVNVIINTAATNCNLPMKFTHYDMGVVNLCSGMPTNVLDIIRGVSALVFIPVIVNYALYLVNKLVSLYRSFQG